LNDGGLECADQGGGNEGEFAGSFGCVDVAGGDVGKVYGTAGRQIEAKKNMVRLGGVLRVEVEKPLVAI
jgi:hypothetical protein